MKNNYNQLLNGKLVTEFKTVTAMMQIYCRAHHTKNDAEDLCPACQQLLTYAETKLDRCPYGEDKPACNRCPIHCYKPQPKQQMKAVMRYAGPRMLFAHPILAIRHLLHERQPAVGKPKAAASNRAKRLQNKS